MMLILHCDSCSVASVSVLEWELSEAQGKMQTDDFFD